MSLGYRTAGEPVTGRPGRASPVASWQTGPPDM